MQEQLSTKQGKPRKGFTQSCKARGDAAGWYLALRLGVDGTQKRPSSSDLQHILKHEQSQHSFAMPQSQPSLPAGALLSRMPPRMPTQLPCFQCLLQAQSQAKRTCLPWGSSWPNTQKLQQLQVACRAYSQPNFGFPVWVSLFGF